MENFFVTYFIQHAFGVRYILFIVISCLSITFLSFDREIKFEKPYFSLKTNRSAYHFLFLFFLDVVLTFLACIFIYSLLLLLFLKFSFSTYYLNFFVYFILCLAHVLLYRSSSWLGRIAEASTLYLSINILYPLCMLKATSLTQSVDGDLYDFLTAFFYFFFLLGIVILLKTQPAKDFPEGELLPFLLLILSNILSLISISVIRPSLSTTDQSRLKYLIIFIGIEVLTILIYMLYYRTLAEKKKAYEKEALVYQKKMEKKMTQLSRENFTQLVNLQEEIKKQYTIIENIINENDTKKLKSYFADIFETSVVPLTFIDCGNTTISAILNIALIKAKKKGIEIEESLLVPSELNFLDYDLCSFFTNIFDNAIEATENMENKKIQIEIEYKPPYLFTICRNPTNSSEEDIKKQLQTTHKEKKEMHGYGTKIISSIAMKYKGAITYQVKNNMVVLKAMLMEPSKKENH